MKPVDGLSFQLYSSRGLEPLERQFELLAELRYRRVEPFGGLLSDPTRLKRALDNHGMMAPSCHVGMDRLRSDARAITKICKDLGIETIFAPAPLVGERDGAEAEWRALGKELAQLGKAVNAEGLAFGWHNHNWEYQKAAGEKAPFASAMRRRAGKAPRTASAGSTSHPGASLILTRR